MPSVNNKINWKPIREQHVIEDFLKKKGIIANGKINNVEELVDYGLFFFLYQFFSSKIKYLSDPEVKGGYFDFYVTSVEKDDKNNIIFLLQTAKDKFAFPKRTNAFISDPLNYLANGNGNHESCPLNSLIRYNAAYLKVNKEDFDIKLPENCEESCQEHKEEIKEIILESRNGTPCILGGWPIILNVDKDLIEGIESAEELHGDSYFNEFLAVYFKYRLYSEGLECSYYGSNVKLRKPFESHEIDVIIQLKNKIIMLETSMEFKIKSANIKKKIYNLWTLQQCFKNVFTFYLTFGEIKDTAMNSFFEFYKQNNTSNDSHFEILHFPDQLKKIESKNIRNLYELNEFQKEIKNCFIEFLEKLERKVMKYLDS